MSTSDKINRRAFVKGAALSTVVGGTLTAGCGEGPGARRRSSGVQSREHVRWRLVSSFTRSLDTLYGAAERFSKRVSQLTGGNFTIKTYQGGEIVPPLEVLDAVQKGSAEIGHSASYYYIGKNPALAFDCTVPFGLTARQQNAWMYEGGGLELMRELFADFGVLNFPGGNTGVQMGGWFREPIGSLAELRGRKMRIPGLGGKVMQELGVTSQVIPGGEVYIALERGAIDAAEWVGPYDDEKLGLHNVAKYYYYPGWWEPAASISYYVNKDAWDKLPKDYQNAIEVASAESNVTMMAGYDARNAEALTRIKGAGVIVQPFPADVMIAAQNAAEVVVGEEAASDPSYAKVYDAFRTWREQSNKWFELAEQGYSDYAFSSSDESAK